MQNKLNIAIFGSGPASIFFCSRFFNTNVSINIYEKGGEEKITFENQIGNNKGPISFFNKENPEYVNSFFGTCSLWKTKGVGGKLQRFDKIDIENNDWPLTYNELDNYYFEVLKELDNSVKNISKFEEKKYFNSKFFKQLSNYFDLKISNGKLTTKFKKTYDYFKKKIKKSKNINIFYNSKVSNFNYSFENKTIIEADVISNNKKFKVVADNYILSTGCINNNVILLNTFKDKQNYLKHFNIGKNLSFHPSYGIGAILFKKNINYNSIKKDIDYRHEQFFLKNSTQDNVINSALALNVIFNYPKKKFENLLFKFNKTIKGFGINYNFEHKATLGNFIKLDKNYNIDKKFDIFTEISKDNQNNLEIIQNDYIKKISDFCKKNDYIFEKSINKNFETNNHHHGGTSFGHNSDKYLVDKNNRLNGFKNMFINGSSVFPSSSIHGPTFTIMALSLRLADQLKKMYGSRI